MPTTLLHTADWQLGKPYARVGDASKRARLQNERFQCLKRLSELVKGRALDFVTIAGDLFDSPSPLNATIATALEAIGSMEVPVFVIPGNHAFGNNVSFSSKRNNSRRICGSSSARSPSFLKKRSSFPLL